MKNSEIDAMKGERRKGCYGAMNMVEGKGWAREVKSRKE